MLTKAFTLECRLSNECSGRLSYTRTAQCINYFFYKNIVFTLPQFIYGAVSAYSGQVCGDDAPLHCLEITTRHLTSSLLFVVSQTFFCDLYITAYNVVFTALPVIARAVMETDVPERVANTFPELYRFGAMDAYFSFGTGFKAGLVATYHAVLLTALPIALFHDGASLGTDGKGGDIWTASVASFFYIVPVVHFQIYFDTWNWTRLVSFIYASSLVFFFMSVAVYDTFVGNVEGVWGTVVFKPVFWLGFCLSTVACLLPWLAHKW